ncbi:hypothetical protein IAQ61_003332, partial [Plenodomus lingam]|uniref:Predicted protein n=1 Tax=Leptosphaeria maculans (strain JN3 / isolate v23.1.3 / race Av1-4-5-6-7-8) TaxID=985895 RepID=E5AE66_LEPMJ
MSDLPEGSPPLETTIEALLILEQRLFILDKRWMRYMDPQTMRAGTIGHIFEAIGKKVMAKDLEDMKKEFKHLEENIPTTVEHYRNMLMSGSRQNLAAASKRAERDWTDSLERNHWQELNDIEERLGVLGDIFQRVSHEATVTMEISIDV